MFYHWVFGVSFAAPPAALYVKDSGLLGYCRIFERTNDITRWGKVRVGFIFILFYSLFFFIFIYSSTGVEGNGDPLHNPTDDLEPRKKRKEGREKTGGQGGGGW